MVGRFATGIFLLGLLGCGSQGGQSVEPMDPVQVQVIPDPLLPTSPSDPTVYLLEVGATAQFHTKAPDGRQVDDLVTWVAARRTDGTAPYGSITQTGLYTAPSQPTGVSVEVTDKNYNRYRGGCSVNIITKATSPAPAEKN